MRTNLVNRIAVALVAGAAGAAIIVSQVAFAQVQTESAQARGSRGSDNGPSELVGRGTIRSSDPRFHVAAAMFIAEASRPVAIGRGGYIFSKTIAQDWVHQTIYTIPREERGAPPRPLTPSEALLMEELFSNDLSKVRGIEVTNAGIDGAVSPRDLGMKPNELMVKARALGAQKSQWYREASSGLATGR